MAVTEKTLPNFNPDKWIKSRLDDLQSESFEYATQNRMFMEDLGELLREMQGEIQTLRSEQQMLRAQLDKPQDKTLANQNVAEIKNLSQRLDHLSKQMTSARKIIRDENGMITAVKPISEQELNQKEGEYKK